MHFDDIIFFGCSIALLFLIVFISIGSIDVHAISVMIDSLLPNQQVPVGGLTIFGTSSDNSTSQCQVFVDWNNLKPYQLVTPTGSNGSDDYSTWNFTYSSNYHLIQAGLNELTSKITCLLPTGPTVSKWYSVNVTGIGASTNQSTDAQLPLPTAELILPNSNIQSFTS